MRKYINFIITNLYYMNYFDLIKARDSVRASNPYKKVENSILLKIADAGRIAPSAANRQPWKFLMVSSDEMLKKVRQCYHQKWYKNAPHILIVVGDKTKSWVRQSDNYNFVETDLAIAMDHMILAAEAEGIGTCWISAFDNKILRESLELTDNEVVYSITPLGYPNEGFYKKREKIRKPLDEVVKFI